MIAWRSTLQDGEGDGIFLQRFDAVRPADIDGNGEVDSLTDGVLAMRYIFGFRGSILIDNAVGSGCTRCTAPAIEGYLAGMV